METISWYARVRNEEELHRVKKERNILRKIKIRKIIGLVKYCLETDFKNIIEGNIEGGI
jgi:hypothetical protein